jgi:hypothetical protein
VVPVQISLEMELEAWEFFAIRNELQR